LSFFTKTLEVSTVLNLMNYPSPYLQILHTLICFKEHNLGINEIDTIVLPNYRLGSKFCRNTFKNGGVCIFTHKSIQSTNMNLNEFCKEKDLEICAAKLHLPSHEMWVITHYRSPSGNYQYFIDKLETILMLYSNSVEIIICGDININYLIDSTSKRLLDSLLACYGLHSTVQFPTRIQNNSYSTIDNICIDTFKFSNFKVYLSINGLSDHDAQSIILHKILEQNSNTYFYYNQKRDKLSIIDFNTKLSYESWEDIFTENDVNTIFNNFLNTYLRIFQSNFPLKKVHHKSCKKAWLTPGIKISCINKRKLFFYSKK